MAAPLHSLVSQQEALVHEAALALPSDFSTCTYDLGYIKQAVYLCLTCAQPRGICAACSIACHSDHEQIELFPKRHFCCDCPTSSLAHPCTLKKPTQPANRENAYGQNFERGGRFCRCSQTYDAALERETMVQCVACQDWFHESCLGLRERVPPRDAATTEPPQHSNVGQTQAQMDPEQMQMNPDQSQTNPGQTQTNPEQTHPDDDASSTASDPSLPPALIPGDTYDTLICGSCVLSNPTVRRYAGTPGARMLALGGQGGKGGVYRIIGEEIEEQVDVEEVGIKTEQGTGTESDGATEKEGGAADGPSGTKRRLSPDAHPPSKRQRASVEPDTQKADCIAPENPVAQAILDELEARLGRVRLVDQVQSDVARVNQTVPAAALQLDPSRTLSTDTQGDRATEAETTPHPDTSADKVGTRARAETDIKSSSPEVHGDLFLSAGWRERWCRCARCDPPLLANPYLLEEEETYEPPKDPDAGLSLEELGMRALATLPHERALDSIRAYNSMRDDLMLYLRPFAESGREVSEADITAFFEQRRQR